MMTDESAAVEHDVGVRGVGKQMAHQKGERHVTGFTFCQVQWL